MRFAFLMLMVAGGWSQPRVDIHAVPGRASDRLKEAERLWRKAQQSSWRNASAPEELAVVAAVVNIYQELFQPELRSAPRIATLTEKGQDILVAQWTPGDQSCFSELIVWDTPEHTSFIFRLPVHSWSSSPQIRSSFERLLLPPRSDGQTPPAKGVTVNIARDPYTHQRVGAGGVLMNYMPRQFDIGYLNFPSNMRSIPERFPPLESRVGQWSNKRILDELIPGGFRKSNRDRVLANELLRRNLTDDELLSVLNRRKPDVSGIVLRTVVEEHQVVRFAGAIRRYLQGDRAGENKANLPFDIVDRTDEANFTEVALDVLRQDCRASPAFRYVAAHGTTLADYRALAELPCLEEWHWREWYLSEMRRRLGLIEDSMPKQAK